MAWCLAPYALKALYLIGKFTSQLAVCGFKWPNGPVTYELNVLQISTQYTVLTETLFSSWKTHMRHFGVPELSAVR